MAGAKRTRSMGKAIPDMAIGSKHTAGAVIISANTSTIATKAGAITAGASSIPDTIPTIIIAAATPSAATLGGAVSESIVKHAGMEFATSVDTRVRAMARDITAGACTEEDTIDRRPVPLL